MREEQRDELLALLNSDQAITFLRSACTAMQAECSAMAKALTKWTHEYVTDASRLGCSYVNDNENTYCGLPFSAAVHHTPTVIRAELELLEQE